jgi:hypothetical protein
MKRSNQRNENENLAEVENLTREKNKGKEG